MQAARVTSLRVPPERAEEVSDVYRSTLVPPLQERVPGFSALLLLVNEEAGSAIEIALFESGEDRRRTEEDGGMLCGSWSCWPQCSTSRPASGPTN